MRKQTDTDAKIFSLPGPKPPKGGERARSSSATSSFQRSIKQSGIQRIRSRDNEAASNGTLGGLGNLNLVPRAAVAAEIRLLGRRHGSAAHLGGRRRDVRRPPYQDDPASRLVDSSVRGEWLGRRALRAAGPFPRTAPAAAARPGAGCRAVGAAGAAPAPDGARAVPRPGNGSRVRASGALPLRPGRPLVGPSDHRESELALPQRRDHQPAPPIGGIRLRVACGTERDQAVEVEVRAA